MVHCYWSGILHCQAVKKSQPPFHPPAVTNCSWAVGMNFSSHNEAFSSQLCSTGFQFHTQPSVSPLNGHHCPRHMLPRPILSTALTCGTAESPLSLCVPTLFSRLPHIVAHSGTAPLVTSLFVLLMRPSPANLADVIPVALPSSSCLSVCLPCSVMSKSSWTLTSRSAGDDRPDETLNQYLMNF